MMRVTYTGEGSLEEPEFPLKYTNSWGKVTICDNREQLLAAMEEDSAVEGFMVLAGAIGFALIFITLALVHVFS